MPALTHVADIVTGTDDPQDFDPSTDSGEFDAAIASDGLTLDTEFGPVDRVVIERARRGDHSVVMTKAEFFYLLTVLPPTLTAARPVAAVLNVSADALRKRAHGEAITARKIA
jgi:hypothetical protein